MCRVNAVFTIAAKNYLPYARTLGDSLKSYHPGTEFYVLLSDENEGQIEMQKEKYNIIEFKSIRPDVYKDMAFKYDILEFSTAVKPFFIEYLFKKYNYEKVIYFDPDIALFNTLDSIFDSLDNHFMILTPHLLRMSKPGEGAIPEEIILFVGTYNLGFIALKNGEETQLVLEWWKERLVNQCYADRLDALHVDQKWMELIPAFFDSGVLVSRHPGYNVSHSNMHERSLTERNGLYHVDGVPLIFFHYTGFDPRTPETITNPYRQRKFTLANKPEYRGIFLPYAQRLKENGMEDARGLSYAYGRFADGTNIYSFQRRFYRRLCEQGYLFGDPFATGAGSFYELLEANRMLIADKKPGFREPAKKDFTNIDGKLSLIWKLLGLFARLAGAKRYSLFMRLLLKLAKPEEHVRVLTKGLGRLHSAS